MSQIGIGVMMHCFCGGAKHEAKEYAGRKITAAKMEDERLTLTFGDGVSINVWDEGQVCCETRYMTTDDDINSLVGYNLINIENKPGEDVEDEYGDVHEIMFVEVSTTGGFITITNHNEHDGCYGGFDLTITEHKQ